MRTAVITRDTADRDDPRRRKVPRREQARGESDVAGAGSILGNEVLRLEDPTLLTGEGKYVDELGGSRRGRG